ncbi:MAG: DbpA RNA binding domain-containing protein, partial [Tannerellaceae bacterium]
IHYHIPINEEAFIHRNGRTARMNAEGSAFILLGPTEFMPEYVNPETEELVLSEQTPAMEQPDWITVYIGRGKKAKLSKGDIVGFLIQKGGLEKSDVGMIEVKEFHSYVAVRKASMQGLFKTIKDLKIKNMKTKFALSL